MQKKYLLTPGPTTIPERILAVFGQPIIHHRTESFQKLFAEVRQGLQFLFQTKQDVLTLTSSGTGAMEAAVSNLFSRGEKVIVINAGKFGERWTLLAKAYGVNAVEIVLPPGESLQLEK